MFWLAKTEISAHWFLVFLPHSGAFGDLYLKMRDKSCRWVFGNEKKSTLRKKKKERNEKENKDRLNLLEKKFQKIPKPKKKITSTSFLACVQTSPISFVARGKRDVCVTPSLIVFQRPAGFPRFWEHAVIGWHTVRIAWLNADWLLSNLVW